MVLSQRKEQSKVLVVGEEAAKGLAAHLAENWNVHLLSNDEDVIRNAVTEQFESSFVEYEAGFLQEHADDGDSAVIVTERDRAGLLVVQALNAHCDMSHVFVRVDDPQNKDAFAGLNCEILETGALLSPEVVRVLANGDN